MNKKILLILTTSLLIFAPAIQAARPLYDPEPFSTDCRLSSQKLGELIRRAATNQRWQVSKAKNGVIKAKFLKRSHILKVEILFSPKEIDINYGSSLNLKFKIKEGEPVIHKAANKWIKKLEDEIRKQLFMAC